jgi:SAM-dependent methyltransferase
VSGLCPLCRTKVEILFRTKDFNRRISDREFEYHRCPACGLILLSHVPDDLSPYYPAEYYPVPQSVAELLERAKPEAYKLEIVLSHVRSGRLLEVGPAYGNFACLAKEAGFDVVTVEMDSRCCRFLENTLGVRAINSLNVETAVAPLDSLDVAALWHVVEHLRAPWTALEAIARKIRPGGILVIATPNPLAWQFRVLGRRWPHVDAPRHLFLIPPAALSEFLRGVGFQVVSLTTTDFGSIGWNTFGWQVWLGNYFRSQPMKVGTHLAGRLLGKILSPVERREGTGSAYTLVAMKEGAE